MTPETSADQTPEVTPKVRKTRAPKKATAPRAPRAAKAEATVTITQAQLDALIARASGQPAPVAAETDMDAPVSGRTLLGALSQVVEASKPPVKITVDNRTAFNPMNPTNAPRPEMRYPFFQNFDKIEVEDMLPKEYELIPQLKPGLFIKSRRNIPLVEVLIVKRGGARGIHMRYDSKGDKGKELQTYCRDMTEMLEKCIREAAEQAAKKASRRAQGLPEDDEED
jgi:hypothetical protein